MKLNGAAITIETLIAHGVHDVFGIPGGSVLNLYDELASRRDRITHRLTCHEQAAAHAADGYARASGRVGVALATSGPGATNLVTGIATAYLDSSPLVAITGNVPTSLMGKDSFQEVDITGVTMPITKHGFLVKDIDNLEKTLAEAFRIASSGRPGPVIVDIPKDIQIAETEFRGGHPLPELPRKPVNPIDLQAAADLINNSKRPFIYAGGGVVLSNTSDLLRQLAEKLDAPVGLSLMGLSALSSDHPLFLGMTGMHGLPEATQMQAEADLIIGIGVRFSDRATGNTAHFQQQTRILHIDVDDAEIDKNVSADLSVIGDLRDVLPALIELSEQRQRSDWLSRAGEFREAMQQASIANGYAKNGGLSPRLVINAVQDRGTDDLVVATDVGQHQMWVAQFYKFKQPRSFLTSGGLGTMGFGLGAANGASIARNKARTLLFTSDGSFHMNMNEFATAVRYQLPIVVVILNNSVLGMVRQWQTLFYGARYSETTLDRPTDYVKLAEALGGRGFKATNLSQLEAALDAAFACSGPVLVDCQIDREASVYPIIPPDGSFNDMII
ncbi:MAG: biosynthetic-type acetolactate synthase large subunit, partial [Coriobacteriales bacterium]|nr:biosynthetic-type acetolactate synthase large subunit [Coriobacteriales bacterium]